MNCLIYKATSPSGKIYIGKTNNFSERKRLHKVNAFNQNAVDYPTVFHKAIRKYGFESIKWEILEENIPEELLNIKECEWIQGFNAYKKGYNQTLGGEGIFRI